jgi:Thiamine pyrophosphate enzyme, N-terminal TPP binding domain
MRPALSPHVFGIPGDYCLGLFKVIEQSPLALIGTCDEQGAGFAADAYWKRDWKRGHPTFSISPALIFGPSRRLNRPAADVRAGVGKSGVSPIPLADVIRLSSSSGPGAGPKAVPRD